MPLIGHTMPGEGYYPDEIAVLIASVPMSNKTAHDGDCTIYSSLCNKNPYDGICTCGYGWQRFRAGDRSAMIAAERKADTAVAELMACLRDLHDHQNGPPLPSYEKPWTDAMEQAEKLLEKHNA